jgi:hypothetical protein
MKFWDAFLSLLIILLFLLMFAFTYFSQGLKAIQQKWPEYRCNPIMMPFASQLGPTGTTTGQNFTSCVQSEMKGMMGDLMKPIHYIQSLANSSTGGMFGAINEIRKMFDYARDMVKEMITKIIGIFMNIIIEFQKIIMGMKDLGSKVMGIMTVLLLITDGMYKTAKSVWAGPVGSVIRFLCFHPSTPMLLKDGTRKKMCDIKIGDILSNGITVLGTLELKGSKINPYYRIYSNVLKQDILVTGSHLVKNPRTGDFVAVSDLEESIKDTYYTDSMNCLITSDHRIPVGEYIFWDWEDGN